MWIARATPFLASAKELDDEFATIFCEVEGHLRRRETVLDVYSRWDMTVLRRVDASRNMSRFYALGVERTLFGEFALVREWGRIGCLGQRRSVIYPTLADAEAALVKLRQVKQRRGYRCDGDPVDLLPSSEEPQAGR
jgi:predicted DNA-binding WGR domain protein